MTDTIEPKTKTSGAGGGNRPPSGISAPADFPDDIRKMGDQIASLTLSQAWKLRGYIRDQHGVSVSVTHS